LASDPEEICDLFAEFVQRTNTDNVWVPPDSVPDHVLDDPPFGALQFTADEVESVLQDLDVNKGSGPMAYHRSFLRTVHLVLQNHYHFFLTGIWQRAFFQTGGRFHTLLRYPRKVGVTTLKTGVAILSTISNRFELLVYRGMYNDLKNLININQHGFMKNRSTITNLLEYASFVLNSIAAGYQVDSVYKDFSKAFDRVRHQLLLNEMSVDIEPASCMWLGSYLSGRIQKIRIGDAVSKDIKVISRVPQGNHLRPLCFICIVKKF
jgi:hypothetical protein